MVNDFSERRQLLSNDLMPFAEDSTDNGCIENLLYKFFQLISDSIVDIFHIVKIDFPLLITGAIVASCNDFKFVICLCL